MTEKTKKHIDPIESIKEPKVDSILAELKLAWQFYKETKSEFFKYTIISTFGYIFIGSIAIYLAVVGLIQISRFVDIPITDTIIFVGVIAILIPQMLINYALFGATYGLAFDLLSTGDLFAEAKGALVYLKHYWWRYCLVFLINGGLLFAGLLLIHSGYSFGDSTVLSSVRIIVGSIIAFLGIIWHLATQLMYPSLTATGSLKQAFKENFLIFKEQRKKVLQYWLFYILFYYVPSVILIIIPFITRPPQSVTVILIIVILYLIFFILYLLFLLNPISILVITLIYNQSKVPDHESHRRPDAEYLKRKEE